MLAEIGGTVPEAHSLAHVHIQSQSQSHWPLGLKVHSELPAEPSHHFAHTYLYNRQVQSEQQGMMLPQFAIFFGLQQPISQERFGAELDQPGALKVPGRNPFFYCNQPNPYTLQIDHLHLTPNDTSFWEP